MGRSAHVARRMVLGHLGIDALRRLDPGLASVLEAQGVNTISDLAKMSDAHLARLARNSGDTRPYRLRSGARQLALSGQPPPTSPAHTLPLYDLIVLSPAELRTTIGTERVDPDQAEALHELLGVLDMVLTEQALRTTTLDDLGDLGERSLG